MSVLHSTYHQNSDILCRNKNSVVVLKSLLPKLWFGYSKLKRVMLVIMFVVEKLNREERFNNAL